MANCQEISRRLSDSENMSWLQRIELFFHMIYCPPCWFFKKQLDLIEESFLEIKKENLTPEQLVRVKKIAEDIIKKYKAS